MSAADVGQTRRRRPPTFFSSSLTLTPTSAADVGLSFRRVSSADSHQRRPPTSAADVGVSVGKLDRQCRRPTLADTQADTQSVTLVSTACVNADKWSILDFITPIVHRHGRSTRLGTCLVQLQCVSCVVASAACVTTDKCSVLLLIT